MTISSLTRLLGLGRIQDSEGRRLLIEGWQKLLADTKIFEICSAVFLKSRHMSVWAFHKYILEDKCLTVAHKIVRVENVKFSGYS